MSEDQRGGRLSAAEVGALVALVILVRVFAVYSFPTYDDAFITWRYAANLAAGHGLVFNPGAPWEPVLGTTTPLYALLLAGLKALGLDPSHASLGVNLACDGASALLLAHLLGRRRLAVGFSLLLFATWPALVRISVGGMEPPLFAALALGSVALAGAGRRVGAGALAALACTVRPEAVLLVALLAVLHVRSPKDALRLLTPVVVYGLAAAGALWAVYGNPIPQSVLAKAGNHGLGVRMQRTLQVLEQSFAPLGWTVLALPLVVPGLVRALRSEARLRGFVLLTLAMSAAYAAAGAKTWGWYYYLPLITWCVALGLGVESLLWRLPSLRDLLDRPLLTLGAALLAALSAYGLTRLRPDPITPNVYEPMAAWVREVDLAGKRRRVEASDIGAIGYFSGALVLDSEGLVWPQARRYGGQLALIEAERPDYVLMVAEKWRLLPFSESVTFVEYEPVARFNAARDTDLRPDPATLPETWIQDYIIFRRRSLASGGE